MNGTGFRSPETGTIQSSNLDSASAARKRRNLPSGDQSQMTLDRSEWRTGSSAPEPFALIRYTSGCPSRVDVKAILDPSGAQTGAASVERCDVSRVAMPPDDS